MPPDTKTPEIVARYGCATLDELVAKHAEDVSAEGMLLRTASALAVGKLVDFEVQLEGGKAVLSGAGRVAWKRDAPDGERPAGVAIKFVDLDEAGRAVVEQFLAARMTEAAEFDLPPLAAPASAAKRTVLGMGSPFAAAPQGNASPSEGTASPPAPASAQPPRSKTALGLSPVQVNPEAAARVGTHLGLAPPTLSAGLVLDEPSAPAAGALPASRPQATSDIDQGWLEPAKGAAKDDGKAPSSAAKRATGPQADARPRRGGTWLLVGLLVFLALAMGSYRFRAELHDAGLPAIPTIDALPDWLSGDSPTSEPYPSAAAPAPDPRPAAPPPPQAPAPKGKSGGSRK